MYCASSKAGTSSGKLENVAEDFRNKSEADFNPAKNSLTNDFGRRVNNENLRKNAIFHENYSLSGRTYGTTTFEHFAKEGSPRYQDLWLKNPINPFAVTSVHSMSQSIPDKMESENAKKKLSSCVNLSKRKSGLFNMFPESNNDFLKSGSLSNHASASNSEQKLSDISTPKQSSEYLEGDGSGPKYQKKYDIERPQTSDYPNPLNMFPNTQIVPDIIPGNKHFFRSGKLMSEELKSSDCMEYIKKCLEDLDM
ncbi:hypothetical protein WA026_015573 [Henosepilachna vigintioctopunctata]|uniref:Uncharacterized protein n=1 Tax=Henosepilachna vigintioctopunctata TaxID=420089 RepID=A0AAW1VE76_9CUCU